MNENPYAPPPIAAYDPAKPQFRRSSYQYKPMQGLLLANKVLAIAATVGSVAIKLIGGVVTAISEPRASLSDQLTTVDILFVIGGLILMALMTAWAVVFLMAAYRVMANAHVVGAPPPETSAGFMVGSYFIPILFLFKPYTAMKEAYRACGAASRGLLGLWWTSFIVSHGLSQLSARITILSLRETVAAQARRMEQYAMIIDFIELPMGVALAVLSHLVLSRLAARQEVLASQPHAVSGWSPAMITPPPLLSKPFSQWGGD